MFSLPSIATGLLPFRRSRSAQAVQPLLLTSQSLFPLALVPPVPTMSSPPTPATRALAAMLQQLEARLPLPDPSPPPNAPPAAGLSLVSVVERAVGLGSHVGVDHRGPFSVAALKGLRLEAVARYQLWAATPADLEQATNDLITSLLGDREVLRQAGFLRVALKHTGISENVFAEDAWRQSVEFEVLFEFSFVDADDAESLIARIPIAIRDHFTESTLVTGDLTRWDNESAPSLALRGALKVGRLSALAFVPGTEPAGAVTLTRTFDGASGPPPAHPDLTTFLAAVTDPNNPAREAEVVFASLSDFLSAFTAAGDPVALGDWDENLLLDEYNLLELAMEPPIQLPHVTDRFEIVYDLTPSATDFVVVYLGVKRRLTN